MAQNKDVSEMNIYERLEAVRRAVEVVQKNKAGYGYKYVTDEELLSKITPVLAKYKLMLIPSISPDSAEIEPYTYEKTKLNQRTKEPYTEINNDVLVSANMNYKWLCTDKTDEFVVVPWIMVGQQSDASQAFGSGLTYSYRYFLLKFFGVATPEDDADNWRSKQRASEAEREKVMAEETVAELDRTIKGFLESNPDKQEDVKKLVSGYVKSGNYLKISEPKLAAKLLSDFTNEFLKESE